MMIYAEWSIVSSNHEIQFIPRWLQWPSLNHNPIRANFLATTFIRYHIFFLSFFLLFFFWTYLKLIMSVLQNFPINVISITSFDVLIVDKKFVGVRFEPLTLWLSDLSINGVWSHLHTPMHSSICLGMLVSHMQNFIWQVNFTPTLRKVCSVMLLPIIHLQLPEWKWALQFFCRHWL